MPAAIRLSVTATRRVPASGSTTTNRFGVPCRVNSSSSRAGDSGAGGNGSPARAVSSCPRRSTPPAGTGRTARRTARARPPCGRRTPSLPPSGGTTTAFATARGRCIEDQENGVLGHRPDHLHLDPLARQKPGRLAPPDPSGASEQARAMTTASVFSSNRTGPTDRDFSVRAASHASATTRLWTLAAVGAEIHRSAALSAQVSPGSGLSSTSTRFRCRRASVPSSRPSRSARWASVGRTRCFYRIPRLLRGFR